MSPLILASASPRRRDLLEEYGYEFRVCPARVEEDHPPHLSAAEMTLYHAKKKAREVALRPEMCNAWPSGSVVIGVDTLVAFEGEPLGKPADLDEAFRMLSRLSGRTHEVFSGVWAVCRGPELRQTGRIVRSEVTFHPFDSEAIRRYLARIEPLDKAGSYAAQDDHPDTIVASIAGSRTNVIGLPMETLAEMLAALTEEPGEVK